MDYRKLIRYRVLDRCFQSRSTNFTFDMLKEEILDEYDKRGIDEDINTRQLRSDISFMKSAEGWSIELEKGLYDGKKGIYRYAKRGYSINKQHIHSIEKEYLEMALFVLDRFRTQKGKEWVNEAMPRIEQEILLSSLRKCSIEYYQNPFLKGLHFIEGLLEAIINKLKVRIYYSPFNKDATTHEISPYLLKEYNNRWYVIGKSASFDSPLVLALDRIDDFETLSRKSYQKPPWDLEDYFEDIIGVTRKLDDKLVKIELQFSAHRAGYVITKPLHGSQKTVKKNPDGSLVISLELIPNKEMYSQLLFFGEDVKVLKPKKVAKELQAILLRAVKQY